MDLAYLHKRDLQGNTLSYRRRKTGRALTVSLTPEAMQMVRMIANKDKDSPYLFPILQSEEGTEAAYREYQARTGSSLHRCGIYLSGTPCHIKR